jgi:hypothetical protein
MKSWLQLKTFKNFVEGLSLFPLLFERESIDLPRDQVTSSTGGWLVGKKLDISDPSLAIYIYIIYIYNIYIFFQLFCNRFTQRGDLPGCSSTVFGSVRRCGSQPLGPVQFIWATRFQHQGPVGLQ